jgi:D-alanyl-D-alanine carboxypeptidase
LYRIASISKTFTSLAILQLSEKKLLKLDDKVSKYIPWFKAKNTKSNASKITIRQLLSHTSGVFRDGTTSHWVTGKFPSELHSAFGPDSLLKKPRSGFKYSNYAFAVLGEIIEAVSGMSYQAYIQKNIFNIANMKESHTDYTPRLKNLALGYSRAIPTKKITPFVPASTRSFAPATGLVSSVTDLSKFITLLSRKPHSGFISNSLRKDMFRPHAKTFKDYKYGLGVDISKVKNRTIISHSGGFNGFLSQMAFDTKTGLGVIVLVNSLNTSALKIATGIFISIFSLIDNPTKYKSSIGSSKKYEGYYRNVWGDDLVVRFNDVLISFSPRTDSPLDYALTFMPSNKKDQFIIRDDNVFNLSEERAIFKSVVKGKFSALYAGSTPSRRVP